MPSGAGAGGRPRLTTAVARRPTIPARASCGMWRRRRSKPAQNKVRWAMRAPEGARVRASSSLPGLSPHLSADDQVRAYPRHRFASCGTLGRSRDARGAEQELGCALPKPFPPPGHWPLEQRAGRGASERTRFSSSDASDRLLLKMAHRADDDYDFLCVSLVSCPKRSVHALDFHLTRSAPLTTAQVQVRTQPETPARALLLRSTKHLTPAASRVNAFKLQHVHMRASDLRRKKLVAGCVALRLSTLRCCKRRGVEQTDGKHAPRLLTTRRVPRAGSC